MGMDPRLLDFAKSFSPLMNEAFINGLAEQHMKDGVQLIHETLKVVAQDFPEGWFYDTYSLCSPEEELAEETPIKVGVRAAVDIAQSDIYLIRLHFYYCKGPGHPRENLEPHKLFMPHVGDSGSIMLSGSRHFISPVLSDVITSYDRDRIFVQFRRAKFHIGYHNHGAIIDNVRVETSLAWSVLYHLKSAQRTEVRKVALLHYLLGHCGLKMTFKHYGNCDVLVSNNVFSVQDYPKDEWVHVHSANPQTKPFYGGSKICLVLNKAQYEANKNTLNSMITALYFIMDRFNTYISADHVEILDTWRMTLGMILWDDKRPAVILEDVNKHFDSLDRYVDDMVAPVLARINMPSETLYDFLMHCIRDIDDWYEQKHARQSDLYRKELTVLPHVFSEFNDAIFKFYFDLINEHNKNGLTKDSFSKLLKDHLKGRMVFNIKKGRANISSMGISGDNKFFKATCILTPQTSNAGKRDPGARTNATLHTSIAGAGSYLNLPKKDPSGVARGNPYLILEEGTRIMQNPDNKQLEDETQARIVKTLIPSTVNDTSYLDQDYLRDVANSAE